MLYLRLPVAIDSSGEALSGEVYLPSRMRGLSICVDRGRRPAARQWICEQMSEAGMATLILEAPMRCSARHVIAAIDWARRTRFLRNLPIHLVTTEQDAFAARTAAELRPAAVQNVLSTAHVPDEQREFALA